MDIISIVVSLVVTAISLLIISKLPLGIEIDSIGKSVLAAVIFGLLNAFLKPILTGFGLFSVLTFGLASFVANVIIFGLAALLIQGFRLQNKFIFPPKEDPRLCRWDELRMRVYRLTVLTHHLHQSKRKMVQ